MVHGVPTDELMLQPTNQTDTWKWCRKMDDFETTTDQLLKRSHADDQPLNQLQIREFKMVHGVPTDELVIPPTNQTDTWKWCRKMDDFETTTDQLLKRSHADDQPLNQLQIREFKIVHGVPTDELVIPPTNQPDTWKWCRKMDDFETLQINYSKRSHADDQPLNKLQIREFKIVHGVPTDELVIPPTNQPDTWKWCRKMDDFETTTDQLLKRSHADDQPLNQLQIREFKMVHGVPTDELMLQPTKQTHGNGAGRWMTLVTRGPTDGSTNKPENKQIWCVM
ncbi:unnamed protein product [Mytilus coruscus]|uniref:Uncharacterized protein n=1 Tax=Mytilus coruscus TaxID=42192 RepID=A0A6J8B8N4_MYTCO|nr:unnamed protein product [Mytilus coruscus]